ncbi:hypothetical protein pEaSNUABM5_00298 [Erwinia phage pEa_SNUABM_5]|uniref:Uncharacterized protein n=1 Tax=Erwinia phage pEa_SNUABM_5 TaxID=2797313 RepID=A0A7T8EPR3_9CAUD|nr:hypothetical protein MPK73_gp298 [Erwinia phage pEa_SNUABM_5]QQO90440.1 hypothetical protein pEaSNUABM5_00298 [Erwinia phage pEa_SNUABM_5]
MKVSPIQALFRFLDLPRKTEQRHKQHQQQGKPAQTEFEQKLCASIASREASNQVYTAEGKLKIL